MDLVLTIGLVFYFGLSSLVVTSQIGKPRQPVTHRDATRVLLVSLTWIVLAAWSYLSGH